MVYLTTNQMYFSVLEASYLCALVHSTAVACSAGAGNDD